jgi:hypothetical protein
MARSSHGLPKVPTGPVMPDPSTPCILAAPETALSPFQEWPAQKVGGLQPSSTPLVSPRCTPMKLLLYLAIPLTLVRVGRACSMV